MAKALLVMANGSEDIESVAVSDVLKRGNVDVTIAALTDDKSTTIKCAHINTVIAHTHFDSCKNNEYDVIIIPGGYNGSLTCRDSKVLIEMLKQQQKNNKYIAAICAAPGFVLATHGIITKDVKATGYPGCSDNIENYVDAKVVNDKEHKIITSKGPSTAIEFALEILAAIQNQETADKVATDMLLK
jgi:DJ-1 family protein